MNSQSKFLHDNGYYIQYKSKNIIYNQWIFYDNQDILTKIIEENGHFYIKRIDRANTNTNTDINIDTNLYIYQNTNKIIDAKNNYIKTKEINEVYDYLDNCSFSNSIEMGWIKYTNNSKIIITINKYKNINENTISITVKKNNEPKTIYTTYKNLLYFIKNITFIKTSINNQNDNQSNKLIKNTNNHLQYVNILSVNKNDIINNNKCLFIRRKK